MPEFSSSGATTMPELDMAGIKQSINSVGSFDRMVGQMMLLTGAAGPYFTFFLLPLIESGTTGINCSLRQLGRSVDRSVSRSIGQSVASMFQVLGLISRVGRRENFSWPF